MSISSPEPGGLSLGFEQAGFDVLAAVEVDPVHASVHHYHFSECTVIPKSVQNLSGPEIRAASSIGGRVRSTWCSAVPLAKDFR